MAAAGSSLLPASALLNTPKVVNYSLPLANTEYLVSLPIGAKKISVQLRGAALLKIADTSGDIATDLYYTLFPGNCHITSGITGSAAIILYVQASAPAQILEVLYWE
jgi:hypothetical protein